MSSPQISVASIKNKIQRMGQQYQPGNASKPGHIYNPIPFDDFADIPHQREACAERFELIQQHLITQAPATFLDLGCHTGYNCFRMNHLGFTSTGIEKDPLTASIAQDLNALYNLEIQFITGAITSSLLNSLGQFDLCFFLSTYQWLVYAHGDSTANNLLYQVMEQCDEMYFETSMGMEGKMKLPQLPNVQAVETLLKQGPHERVKCLGPVVAPVQSLGLKRYIFQTSKK